MHDCKFCNSGMQYLLHCDCGTAPLSRVLIPNLCTPETVLRWDRPTGPTMHACKSLKMQGNLCIEFYVQKCGRNSIRGRRIFIGFPDKLAKPTFYAGLVSLDFTGDNRRGASQRSNQRGDCCSTQKSMHKSGYTQPFASRGPGRDIFDWEYSGSTVATTRLYGNTI
jgi:hypothetical protein